MNKWHLRPRSNRPPAGAYPDGTVPLPYPAGWFLLALSHEVRPGGVLTCRLMGEDIVVYRTRSGRVRAVRPYCPHLGAHLGCGGRVDGELIVCPFHRFAFGEEGAVARVGPGYTGEPVQDRLAVLPTEEVNRGIFVWAGADPAEPPAWRFPSVLPTAPVSIPFIRTEVRSHPQEIFENFLDLGHHRALHGWADASLPSEPVRDGHRYAINLRLTRAFPPFGRVTADIDVTLYGLGMAHTVLQDPRRGWRIDALTALRPVAPWCVEILVGSRMSIDHRQGWWRKWPEPLTGLLADTATWLNVPVILKDINPDVPIWHAKRYINPPRLARGDGPVGAFRKWARQFYPSGTLHPDTADGPAGTQEESDV
ncbi:Rieske 2Fe-2S domain-containing protein [Streptomyces morookaense]|uniref:Rieske 2Fe-2S domain-containing protein n=1 Tax=Streptomyces morookaense TaxID=1970 RepID=UPI0033E933E6